LWTISKTSLMVHLQLNFDPYLDLCASSKARFGVFIVQIEIDPIVTLLCVLT
jgi:hypothetical protein